MFTKWNKNLSLAYVKGSTSISINADGSTVEEAKELFDHALEKLKEVMKEK